MFQKDIKLVIKNGAKCAVIGEEKPSTMGKRGKAEVLKARNSQY
jgi:hypothetical protein